MRGTGRVEEKAAVTSATVQKDQLPNTATRSHQVDKNIYILTTNQLDTDLLGL